MGGTYTTTVNGVCAPTCTPGQYYEPASSSCAQPSQCGAGYESTTSTFVSANAAQTMPALSSDSVLVCPSVAPFPCRASIYASYLGTSLGCCANVGDTTPIATVSRGTTTTVLETASFVAGSVYAWRSAGGFAMAGNDAFGTTIFAIGIVGSLASAVSYTCPPYALPAGRWSSDKDYAICYQFCKKCLAGTFATNSVCQACASGSYTISVGSSVCSVCAAGTYAPSASAPCASCSPGFYTASAGLTLCTACAVRTYAVASGVSVCTPCAAGTGFVNTYTPCTPCAPGTAAATPGACVACAAQTYAPTAGAVTCTPCTTTGYAAPPGSSTCTPCPAGTRASSGLCVSCGSGTFAPSAASVACIGCSSGTYAPNTGLSACFACIAGTFQASLGMSYCTACAAGTASAVVASAVEASATDNMRVINAPATTSTTATFACPSTAPYVCGFAYEYEAVSSVSLYGFRISCCAKPASSVVYAANFNGWSAMAPLYTASFRTNAYMARFAFVYAGGSSPALMWASDQNGNVLLAFQSNPGANYQSTIAAAATCPPNAYVSAFNMVLDTYTGILSSMVALCRSACSMCAAGTYASSASSSICLACAPGAFGSSAAASACTACAAGTYANTQRSLACPACSVGTYASSTQSTACAVCAPATYAASAGAASCAPACSPGRYASALGPTSSCKACDAGTYSTSADASACLLCPVNQFANSAGSSACISGGGNCPLAPCPVDMFCS
jgi:syndecan 4